MKILTRLALGFFATDLRQEALHLETRGGFGTTILLPACAAFPGCHLWVVRLETDLL